MSYSITKKPTAGGNYPVFLSHDSKDEHWEDLKKSLIDYGIDVNSDAEIQPGDPNFARTIKEMIQAHDIMILLISSERLKSWMIYELGFAAGLGKKIILFSYSKIDERKNHLFEQYGPVINDLDFLVREIKNSFFFAELFEYETENLNKSIFLKSCIENIDLCNIRLDLPGIEEIPKHVYKFGYILLALSRYEKTVNDKRNKSICNMTADDLYDGICELDNMPCSLCMDQGVCSDGDDTDVILNKILYNTSVDIITQKLKIVIPFNRKRGVTFKCFVDIKNMDYAQNIITVLEKAGLQDVKLSHSAFGNRIYFLLPQKSNKGSFTVEAPDGPINNYLCKGSII